MTKEFSTGRYTEMNLDDHEKTDYGQNSAELKIWQEMLKPVFEHMKVKKDFPESEQARKTKILVLILAGGRRGAYADGQVLALEAMGYFAKNTKPPVIDTVIGISAGAKTGAFALAGQAAEGAALFYDKSAAGEISTKPSRWSKIMDVDSYIRRVEGKLDQQAVLDSPTQLFAQVSDAKDGTPRLVNAKQNLINTIHASSAVPLLYGKTVNLEGRESVDGGYEPISIEQIIKQFHPTDILILPNMPFDETNTFKAPPYEKVLMSLGRLFPKKTAFAGQREKLFGKKQEFRKAMELLKEKTGTNIAMLWPEDLGLSGGIKNLDKVKAAIFECARKTLETFGEPEKATDIKLL